MFEGIHPVIPIVYKKSNVFKNFQNYYFSRRTRRANPLGDWCIERQ